jgi:uncharacterized membrane protein
MQRLARDERGGAAVITAISGAVLAGVAAISVDLGVLYFEARKCQTAADLAALAGARDIGRAEAAASATAAENVEMSRLVVERGVYRADRALAADARFAPDAAGGAVRVSVTTRAPLYFGAWIMGRDSIEVTRTATAAAEPMAAYSIGSRLASLEGGMANGLLSALTGSEVRLRAMDYRALASADVSLLSYFDALATELDLEVGRYDEILDEEITAPQALGAIARVLEEAGLEHETGLVEALAADADADRTLRAGDLFGLDDGLTPSSLRVEVEALDLAQAVLVAANGERQLALDLGSDFGLAALDVSLAIGERPNQSPWMTVTNDAVIVRTAQSRLFVRARVGGSGSLAVVNVPILIELASAEARLDTLACRPDSVDLEVRTGVGQIAIADIETDRLHRFTEPLALRPAALVNTPLLRVTALSDLRLGGDTWQTTRFNARDIADREVRTVRTVDLAQSLMASLIEDSEVEVRLLGLGLGSRDLVGRQVADLLQGLARPLDELLLAVSAITGARLGEADVRVTGLRCGAPVLVG